MWVMKRRIKQHQRRHEIKVNLRVYGGEVRRCKDEVKDAKYFFY